MSVERKKTWHEDTKVTALDDDSRMGGRHQTAWVQSVVMPSASFRHQATTRARLEQVWDELQDSSTWAEVAGAERTYEVETTGTGLQRFKFEARVGGIAYTGTAKVTLADEPTQMTVQVNSSHLVGAIDVQMSPAAEGTDIVVTMTMRSAGFVTALAFPAITAAVDNGFADSVERLAHRLD